MKTDVDGLVWPAVAKPSAALRLSILRQLETSQWLTAEMLEKYQLLQLEELLKHASLTVPYYKEILIQAGWNASERLTCKSFMQIPILKREQVNNTERTLNSTIIPKGHGRTSQITTSGSTGTPVTVFTTGWCQVMWDTITLRDHVWHKREFSGTLAVIRHLPVGKALAPDGVKMKNWGPPVSPLYESGNSHALNIRSTMKECLDWLVNIDPEYLLTFPSVAKAVAQLCIKEGISLNNLREVRTIGESLPDDTRSIVQESWRVPLVDCYSAQEIGYIALQAPGANHYLVQSESVYVEILDENDQPCKPGEAGRVIVTPLQNFATPLIRYELGDYAELGGASSCGRGLPVLNKILGRSRNMLVMPNGDRRFPSLGIKTYNSEYGERIRGYQVVQKTNGKLIIKLLMDSPYSPDEEKSLKEYVQKTVHYPFEMQIEYVNEIPRSKTGKFEDFYSEVTDALLNGF